MRSRIAAFSRLRRSWRAARPRFVRRAATRRFAPCAANRLSGRPEPRVRADAKHESSSSGSNRDADDPLLCTDKFDAALRHPARREGETTFAGPGEPFLARLEQPHDGGMQKKPRITALHPADDSRLGLLITDIVGPGRQTDRDGVPAVRNRLAQILGTATNLVSRQSHRKPRGEQSASIQPVRDPAFSLSNTTEIVEGRAGIPSGADFDCPGLTIGDSGHPSPHLLTTPDQRGSMQSFGFHPIIETWFDSRFAGPTDAQTAGWPAIASGEHTLIAAPTGSGKTLAAFLACIDRLLKRSLAGELEEGSASFTSRRCGHSPMTCTATSRFPWRKSKLRRW